MRKEQKNSLEMNQAERAPAWEYLTEQERQICSAAGNFFGGFYLPQEQRHPFQSAIATVFTETEEGNDKEQKSNPYRQYAHALRQEIVSSEVAQRNDDERPVWLGYQILFAREGEQSVRSQTRHMLALTLDQSLRMKRPDNLSASLADMPINPMKELSLPPEWESAQMRLYAYATVLLHDPKSILRDDQQTDPLWWERQQVGDVYLAHENLELLDSLLYPTFSQSIDEEDVDGTGDIYGLHANQILAETITAATVPQADIRTPRQRELFSRLLLAGLAKHESLHAASQASLVHTLVVEREQVRAALLVYADAVGDKQARTDFQRAQAVARQISKRYRQVQPPKWYQDRFLNPVSASIHSVSNQESVWDDPEYWDKSNQEFFAMEEIREALEDQIEPKLDMVFVNTNGEILAVKSTKWGIWGLPTEKLRERDSPTLAYSRSLAGWTEGKGKKMTFLPGDPERIPERDNSLRMFQSHAVCVQLDEQFSQVTIPPSMEEKFSDVRWVSPQAWLALVTSRPEQTPPGFSEPSFALRTKRYERMLRTIHPLMTEKGILSSESLYVSEDRHITQMAFGENGQQCRTLDHQKEQESLRRDYVDGYVPTLIVAGRMMDAQEYFWVIDERTGLLSLPQQRISFPGEARSSSGFSETFSAICARLGSAPFYPEEREWVHAIGKAERTGLTADHTGVKISDRKLHHRSYYYVMPTLQEENLAAVGIARVSAEDDLQRYEQLAVNCLREPDRATRRAMLRQSPRFVVMDADAAFRIHEAQQRAIEHQVVQSGIVSTYDPLEMRRRLLVYQRLLASIEDRFSYLI